MDSLPSGTVTFLFTDIESSTRHAQELPDQWESLRARHYAILDSAIQTYGGYVFNTIGDAYCVAFHTAGDALRAAIESQIRLSNEDWGETQVKVRMGIHTGKAEIQENGDYHGYITLSRAQRLMSAGHGGQTLISLATEELIRDELPDGVTLRDMGERRLKDLIRPEHISQLIIPNLPTDFPPLKTLDLYRHNLPAQLTSFIGREKEIAEIKQAIHDHRLVTLTGSGGTGKTRLSLQAAADLLDSFADGIWFIELAPLSNPELIPQTILAVLGIGEEKDKTALQSLTDYLRGKKILLVLDNCEHIIEASAKLADHLLGNAPTLRILASSREALGVKGEMAQRVPSLSLPDPKQLPAIESLSQYEAVRLFIDRAALAQPQFNVTKDNAHSIAQICFRLDGIPLAIELAAARVKTLSVDQIAARLDDRFRLLTGGARTSLPRQQTLRAMIDWSYNLLSEEEKMLFRRLAVFVGGWTLEAAERVCSQEGSGFDVLDLLTRLVDKSLVIVDESRYHMLETTRQYAREKLFDSGEGETLRHRHMVHFAEYAKENYITTDYLLNEDTAHDNLSLEIDNLRAALQWALDSNADIILDLAAPLGVYWFNTNSRAELEGMQQKVLTLTEGRLSELRVHIMLVVAANLSTTGRPDEARPQASAALTEAQALGNRKILANALAAYGYILAEIENADAAVPYYEQALSLARETNNTLALRDVLRELGGIAAMKGNFEQAEAYLQELLNTAENGRKTSLAHSFARLFLTSFALARGDIENARHHSNIALSKLGKLNSSPSSKAHLIEMAGRVDVAQGDLESARRSLMEGLGILNQIQSRPCLAHGLESFARLALAENDPIRAVRFLACAEAHLESLTMSMYAPEKLLYDRTVEAARAFLSESEFASAWEQGRAMKVEQAVELALR